MNLPGLQIEGLEARDVPSSATLVGTTLLVDLAGRGNDHTASIDLVAGAVQVVHDGQTSTFAAADVQSLVAKGDPNSRNVIQNNTAMPFTGLGGNREDAFVGGTGTNVIDPGKGADVVYALLGTNAITSAGNGSDRVFTNNGATVVAGKEDLVVRFFAPGRTPGVPFLGLDPALNDGVLYITPSNNGSSVMLLPGLKRGETLVIFDLGDGTGTQTRTFTGLKAVSYFGGAGNDRYTNNTDLVEAVYGSAGDDVIISGVGDFSLLKGSGGNDTLVGRAKATDISGNGGADLILSLTRGRRDIFRVDAADTVVGSDRRDVFISP